MKDIREKVEEMNYLCEKFPNMSKKLFFACDLYNFICIKHGFTLSEAIQALKYLNEPTESKKDKEYKRMMESVI